MLDCPNCGESLVFIYPNNACKMCGYTEPKQKNQKEENKLNSSKIKLDWRQAKNHIR